MTDFPNRQKYSGYSHWVTVVCDCCHMKVRSCTAKKFLADLTLIGMRVGIFQPLSFWIRLCQLNFYQTILEVIIDISMTSLLQHTVAQPTKWRFSPKNLSQLVIFVIRLACTWVWGDKNHQNLIFKVNFLCQKSVLLFWYLFLLKLLD